MTKPAYKRSDKVRVMGRGLECLGLPRNFDVDEKDEYAVAHIVGGPDSHRVPMATTDLTGAPPTEIKIWYEVETEDGDHRGRVEQSVLAPLAAPGEP